MEAIFKDVRLIFRMLFYSDFLEYHLRKRKKINSRHQVVLKYHYEMAEHYYKKFGIDILKGFIMLEHTAM